ncbi:MAG: PAS domain S-box protein, partial [Candidatus Thermoplasmatota archaeon]|nr:PAS domain S-box protein [Candidatus Thermoplasmatota archaeon]
SGSFRPIYTQAYEKVASSGNPFSFHTYDRPSKKHYKVTVSSGGKGVLATTITDITGGKRIESVLKNTTQRYRSFIENSKDIIFSTDPQGKITYLSPQVVRLGKSPKELINKEIWSLSIPEDRGRVASSFQRSSYRSGKSLFEYRSWAQDGNISWFEVARKIDKDKSGDVGGFSGILMETTERKRAEDSKIRSTRTLRMVTKLHHFLLKDPEESDLLMEVCRLLLELGGYRFVWIGYAEEDEERTIRPMAHGGFPRELLARGKVSWGENEWGQCPAGRAIRTNEPSVGINLLLDPYDAFLRNDNMDRGYNSSIALPLMENERTFGVINIYSAELNPFGTTEIELLMELANEVTYGILATRHTKDDHQRSERVRRESEARFSAFMDHLPAAVFIKDENSRILYINRFMKEHFGADTWLGKSPHEYLPKNAGDAMILDDQDTLAKGYKTEIKTFKAENGVERIFRTDRFAIRREGSSPLLGGIELDITDWKLAEQELKYRLEETQNLYQLSKGLMYSNTLEEVSGKSLHRICTDFSFPRGLLFILDKKRVTLTLTHSVGLGKKDVGYSVSTPIGTDFLSRTILESVYCAIKRGIIIPSGDNAVFPMGIQDAIGFPGPDDFFITVPILSRNVPFGVLILDFGGRETLPQETIEMLAMYMTAVGTAIENVGLYHKLEESYHKLQLVDQKRSDFIDVVAHELRTPLSSIKVYTGLMNHGQIGNFTMEEISYLKDMNSNINHLNKLINEMLDFTRTGEQILNISPGKYDITDMVREIIEDFRIIAGVRGISFDLVTEGVTTANFDFELMKKAIVNLIGNAVKYSHDGGKVSVTISDEESTIKVSIADSGIGIAEEHIDHVFERFYMGDSSLTRDRDKMGLGLTIVKSIIDGHLGTISVESEVEVGSTFKFTIPKRNHDIQPDQ